MTKLDKFDHEILNLVQKSNRISAADIGEKIALSTAAVQRRVNRLRDKGVIIADISVVNRVKVGRPMTFIVEISLERERPDLLQEFKLKMKQNPQVQQCYYVTGTFDFVIIITASDMKGYEDFRQQYLFENPNIKHLRTDVVMDVVKAELFVPVNTSS